MRAFMIIRIRRPAPFIGEHTDEILLEMGVSPAEIGVLHDRRIIAGPVK